MTKVDELTECLRKRIADGDWSDGGALPSRAQFAAEFGVSPATVSSAIRALAKEGVLRIIQGKGAYVAHGRQATGALADQVIGLTGSYLPSQEESVETLFSRSIFDGIWEAGSANRTSLVLVPDMAGSSIADYCRRLNISGLVFLGAEQYRAALELKRTGFPVILSNRLVVSTPLNYVDYDNEFVVAEVVRRLIGTGHRRIGVLAFQGSVPNYFRMMKLYFMEALMEHGALCNGNDYWKTLDLQAQEGTLHSLLAEAVEQLLALPEPPTALFCWDARFAGPLVEVLAAKGVKVPDDLSLIVSAYQDERDAAFSGFVMPHRDLGKALLENLLLTIRNPYHWVQELLRPRYVERGSICPPGR